MMYHLEFEQEMGNFML